MKLNLSFYYFFYFAAIGIYVIFFPNYLKNLGYSPEYIGIIFASLPIARFITPFFFQKKAITTTIFKISIFISVIIPFLFFINNFYIYLVGFTILGVVWSINFPYIEALAINRLGSHYGKTRLWGSVGFVVVALFLSYFNFNLIWLFVILNLITAYFALYFINPDFTLSKHYEKIDFLKEWQFWVALILLQISFGGFYNFFTIYNLTNGIPKEINGWLWTIGVVAEIIIFIYQYKFLNRNNSLFYIKISLFMTSIRWLVLYLFAGNVLLIALSQTLHLFSFAIFHTAALMYISNKYKNQTLVQQFYAGIGYGLASFLGSFISGYLYGENLFLYESIIVLIAFLVLWSKK
jgi:PPP family 3-phenylpropionic acid transporter